MKKFILTSLLLASSQMAMAVAPSWVDIHVNSTKQEKRFIDINSISGHYFDSYDKNNYYVTAWVKSEYPTAQKLPNGKLYRESKMLWYVDCKAGKTAIGDRAYYTSTGKFVTSAQGYVYTHSSDSWERVIPDTVAQGINDAICLIYQMKSAGWQDTQNNK